MAEEGAATATAGNGAGEARDVRGEALAALQRAFSFTRYANLAGLQYGTKRDIFETAGYPADSELTYQHYYALYRRDGVAGKIVDMPAQTTWRTPPEVVEDGAAEPTRFMEAFATMAKRLRLWYWLGRVDRISGIGRYGVLYIGTTNTATDGALAKPVLGTGRGQKKLRPEDVVFLSAFSEDAADIDSWVDDTSDPAYGMPKAYLLDFASQKAAKKPGEASRRKRDQASMTVVDRSRCLHVAEDLLDDNVYGRPRLRRVLNRLYDLEKVCAATGEGFWQGLVRILTGKVDPKADFSEAELDDMQADLEEMVHDLRRQWMAKGVDLKWLESTPPDPSTAADMYMMLIAAGASIPKRILFGTETGERASEQDERQWFGIINERQEHHAEPTLLRAFIDRMVSWGALPAPDSGEYQVLWPPLRQDSKKEKADANKVTADAAAALTPIGGDPGALVGVDEGGEVYMLPKQPPVPPEELPPGEGESGTEGGESVEGQPAGAPASAAGQ